MNLKIQDNSKNYAALVVKVEEIHEIEGADKIQRVVVFGNDIVTSKSVKKGDTVIYFVSGTRLSPDFCKFNNLYSDKELNSDPEAKPGYFNKTGRTKAIKLKNVISDGILLPLESLEYINNSR